MSDDLISRQSAIDAIKKDVMGGLNYEWIIKELPSIQPKQKTGQWISNRHTDTVLCSECKKCYGDEYNYCPNCGAKMGGVK
jgi:hypothetical protein